MLRQRQYDPEKYVGYHAGHCPITSRLSTNLRLAPPFDCKQMRSFREPARPGSTPDVPLDPLNFPEPERWDARSIRCHDSSRLELPLPDSYAPSLRRLRGHGPYVSNWSVADDASARRKNLRKGLARDGRLHGSRHASV